MSLKNQADTMREIANVFLKHEAAYSSNGPISLSDDLVQDIAADLHALRDPINVYNAVYMLDEKPFMYLPHHEANQIQYFMRRFRNSGGWKLVYPWRQPPRPPVTSLA
jgi:hypothetical protein